MKKLFPTSVDPNGLTALINRLSRDCTPDQFVREFVQNSIEAILRTGTKEGKILVDFNEFLASEDGIMKLSFTDNGDGMTPLQMENLLNRLSASGHSNEFENYGIGAKISALSRNPQGILYESWKEGNGHCCYLYFDVEAKQYGMRGTEVDGDVLYVTPRTDDLKPSIVTSHGTRVTLFGQSAESDTMEKPDGVTGAKDTWLLLYLNSRFFKFPEQISISARVGYYRDNPKHNYMATVTGQKAVLDKHTLSRGSVELTDATVHWWILNKERDGHGREYMLGHTATLHNNEILDRADGRSSRASLFGVVLGASDVVIYVEPDNSYVQKVSRTSLVRDDGNPLPWELWADQFRKKMPKELKDYVDNIASRSEQKSHQEVIRERLKEIVSLLKVSKYRQIDSGNLRAEETRNTDELSGTRVPRQRSGQRLGKPNTSATSNIDTLLHVLSKGGGRPVEEVEHFSMPTVQWVSVTDGTRDPEEFEDRAAHFHKEDNIIIANRDFQVFSDMIQFVCARLQCNESMEKIVSDTCFEMFEQQLVETVIGIQSLSNRPEWQPDDIDRAFSEESLTAAVLAKYNVFKAALKEVSRRQS